MAKNRNAWRERMMKEGRCIFCGSPRESSPFKSLCKDCGCKVRARQRRERGSKAWQKRKPGRPPKTQTC